jgi:hypothetical protein
MNPFRGAIALAAGMFLASLASPVFASQDVPKAMEAQDMSGLHDFDFLVGEWRVHSRRLKEALAGSHEWYAFDGTIVSRPLMEGRANVDDTVFNLPQGIYRGVAPRAYDPRTGEWAIWWIDGRNPFGNLDPPVKGKFVDGVGTFYASDTLRGKPIKVRFIWSRITTTTARWEQAYSPDGGKTWETNWEQTLERTR